MFYNKQLYLNPGLPEVRKLVSDGVSEIVGGYAVDGIIFDDYFYPYLPRARYMMIPTRTPYTAESLSWGISEGNL